MTQVPTDSPVCCVNPDCGRSLRLVAQTCPNCGTPLRLGDRYIPLQLLSSGRFTTTYTVYDLKAKREAILKVMIEATPQTAHAFRQNVNVLAGLRHVGLPVVAANSYFQIPIKVPRVQMLPCFVMEKIVGKSLKAVLEERPNGCPEAWVVDWLIQAANTLQVVHKRQVIHGNLKPDNMLLKESGALAIVGFGSTHRLNVNNSTGQRPSSQPSNQDYKAPEQSTSASLQPSMDVYALGRIAIHLLTGTYPTLLVNQSTGQLRWQNKARVSRPVASLLDRMTHPQAQIRPQSMTDLQTALNQVANRKGGRAAATWAKTQEQRRSPVPKKAKLTAVFAPIQTLDNRVDAGIERVLDWGHECTQILRSILQVGLGGAIGAGLGYWLIFSSPVAAQIWQVFATALPKLGSTSITFTPILLIFMLAGLGSVWAGIYLPSDGKSHRVWSASLLGAGGYGLGWVSWQWVAQENTLQAFTRVTAIAALFLALELSPRRPLFLHAIVTTIGTSITFSLLIRSGLLKVNDLFMLFPDGVGLQLQPTPFTPIMSVIFFALVGGVAYFWAGFSQRTLHVLLTLLR